MERMFLYFIAATLVLLVLALVIGFVYIAAQQSVRAYLRFRGQRVVVCPETRKHVAVDVDARHAATTAALGEAPELRLVSCTRWPERADCAQDCLAQIERAPEDCRVRTMLDTFYAGRACVFCAKPVGDTHWYDHQPALLAPDRQTIAWADIAPEQVPAVLKTHKPVCWHCYVAESFRAAYPDMTVERPWAH